MVSSVACNPGCYTFLYNSRKSSTYKLVQAGVSYTGNNDDDSTWYVNGDLVEDQMCFGSTATNCFTTTFVSLTSTDYDYINDGVIGLSNHPNSIITQLYNQKIINQAQFGFWVGSISSPVASIMFGGYDSTLYQNGNNDDGLGLFWFDDSDNSDTYWNLDITNFTWGNYTTTVLRDAYIFNDRYL